MAGDAGQRVEACAAIDVDVELMRPVVHGAGYSQREGGLAQLCRVDAEEQVVHDRVGDEYGVENVVAVHPAFRAYLADQPVDGLAYGLRHGLAPVGIHHDVGDAAHEVFAEADLRVRCAGGGDDAARQQRHQMHGDGGRADVAGDAVGLVLQPRPHGYDEGTRDVHVAVDGDGDAPVFLAQYGLHLRHDMGGDQRVFPAPVLFQHQLHAVEVAQRLVHVGLVHLDIAELHGRVALYMAVHGGLAHHLRVDDRVLRHVHHQIALNGG
jgi:hypothetical protein